MTLVLGLQPSVTGKMIPAYEEQAILRVPPLDSLVLPDSRSDAVESHVAPGREEPTPICGPLLVEVIRASLERDGGGKKYDRPQPDQRVDEDLRARGRQMLRDLERHHQIELPVELDGSLQIGRYESLGGDEQAVSIDPVG